MRVLLDLRTAGGDKAGKGDSARVGKGEGCTQIYVVIQSEASREEEEEGGRPRG